MEDIIPEGFCQCGCGEKTNIAPFSRKSTGWVRGEPIRYIYGHHNRKTPHAYIIEDRGYATPCWIWQRGLSNCGYGKQSVKGETILAHRVYYERKHGPIGPEIHIHHRCAGKACVNPDHLRPVTRMEHASKHAQLTPEEIQRIRQMLSEKKMPQHKIAKLFGVCQQHISNINVGKRRRGIGV